MSFASPTFLYALSFLAIPIAIHLFNLRKFKRVNFSNVAALIEIQVKTQSRSKLKNLLLLLCRLLAAAALIFAFADPYLDSGSNFSNLPNGKVAIYVDNSPSMALRGAEGILLQQAIARGRSIIEAYPESSQFIILSSSGINKQKRYLSRSEAIDEIESIKPGNGTLSLEEAIIRLKGLSANQLSTTYIISDFQKSNNQLVPLTQDSSVNIELVPLQIQSGQNLYIDSAWFESPTHLKNAEEQLFFRIRHEGVSVDENIEVKVFLNNQALALSSVEPGTSGLSIGSVRYRNKNSAWNHITIELNDPRVSFDNQFFLSYEVKERIQVFLISDKPSNSPFYRLFQGDPEYQFQSFEAGNVNYQLIKNNGFLIIDGLKSLSNGLRELIDYKLQEGHSVLIAPASQCELTSYNNFLANQGMPVFAAPDTQSTRISEMPFNHPFFKDLFDKLPQQIDFPSVRYLYPSVQNTKLESQNLMSTLGGLSFLAAKQMSKGQLFVFYSPINEGAGNFYMHGLFTPCILRMAELNAYSQTLYYTLNAKQGLKIPGDSSSKDEQYELVNLKNQNTRIPEIRKVPEATYAYLGHLDLEPGHYMLRSPQKSNLLAFGVNPDGSESALTPYQTPELDSISEQHPHIKILEGSPEHVFAKVASSSQNQKLWPYFVVLTLIFIALELILASWLR